MPDAVLYQKEERIAILTINRPGALNAMNSDFFYDLDAAIRRVNEDPEVYVAIITGAGDRAFSAGGDFTEMDAQLTPEQAERRKNRPWGLLHGYSACQKPLIAAVNGLAFGGGCELALSCDMIVAAESAAFAVPEQSWGIVAGVFLFKGPRNIPVKIAMEMLCTGDPITAQRAYEIGMVNRVVPKEQLMEEAKALAERVCRCAPLSLRAVKEFFYKGLDIPLEEAQRLHYSLCFEGSEDGREGPRAFVEKRAPVWKGK
jgi:enoyl-CoA hydratase/carnithine racemase